MKLKICGATSAQDVRDAEAAGADYVGLWHGVHGHPRNLQDKQLVAAAQACRDVTPVAVCVSLDIEPAVRAMRAAGVRHVQLHGFTLPPAVAALKTQGFTIIKTLHVDDDGSAQLERWIDLYDRAGVDAYLIDRHGPRGEIGSAGVALPPAVVARWVEKLAERRIWLAGGLTPEGICDLSSPPSVETLDVDSAARRHGRLARDRIALLAAAAIDSGRRRRLS